MDRAFARIEQGLLLLLAGLLAFITVGVFVQVVLRYAFSTSFLWGEELSLFAFIWCVYLGAVVGVRRRAHFGFDALAGRLTGRAAALHRLAVDAVMLAIAALMLWQGWTFSEMSLLRHSPALGISLLVPTAVIPLSGALIALLLVHDMSRALSALIGGERP